ncbi:DUF2723 domain-containing protein [Pedobacter sp. KR3-3]|uniref:DUF2723 domain-containing protein n=1 Tax=Pedobacter albus TaxID=3113905 RepID=A0ABU7I589_9SPHI|nr:DUF2723 domain-containing protein [Pedobacter sp. KR3-3]MEE1944626.1 DUF2723 domain-containing protein [Pedobacter sp. KR3-3]
MKTFKRINNALGFVLFALAAVAYWLCMEPTVSFWDCGEFISASFKLQVGHQPGAPLFLMIGRMFSLLAAGDLSKVAYWVNLVSVLSSAATVMFLFWSINAIALKIVKKDAATLNTTQLWSIIAAGTIGALAYAFSDTFWFSAVESEVYAISTLCTAIVFWAILKWEQQMNDKWILFIAYIIGLSIGIHLLSLLAIPAISLVYYFRKQENPTLWGIAKAFLIGCVLLGIVQFGVIQYFVLFASKFDILFVNSFGLGFGSGALAFVALFALALGYGIYYSIKKSYYQLNLGLLSLALVIFGFCSYFMIIIRANAKTDINLSNPDTPVSLFSYLSRQQYEDKPLLYGQFYNSKPVETNETGVTYRKGDKTYEESGKTYKRVYDTNTFLPRTYSDKPSHVSFYQSWMGLADGQTPTFWQNMSFMNSYQMGFMYWRYFAWNFVGRQNDEQGQGAIHQGNWLSGIKPIDALHLGNQDKLPPSIKENAGYNLFYGLPLVLGLLGMAYLYRKNKKDGLVVALLFFCTGLAIILYINQDPLQVRERDYAYVGSFYAFAILIGIGVLAVKELLARIASNKVSLAIATSLCMLAVPVLMAARGWNDHNRSGKTTALDMAKNYLNSCEPNAILFTNADNDTYPLWYAQEVEGIRTDVRVICLQFLGSEAFLDQMKKQQHLSAPLPISLVHNQYKEGVRDYMPYVDYGIKDSVELTDLLSVLTSDNKEDKVQLNDGSYENFLPTQKLKLTIDPAQILATKTVALADKDKIAPQMEWEFKKNYALKSDLAMFDIIVHNQWKRPIYFATSVSDDTYIGLDKYLYMEGYAYRLLPLKPNNDPNADKTEQTNNRLAFKHYKNFELGGFKKAKYIDPESRRVLQGTWTYANTLSANLIRENSIAQAKEVINKSIKELPLKNYSIMDTLNKISLVQNLYLVNDNQQASQIAKETTGFLAQEFEYILSLKPEEQRAFINDIRRGMYVLQSLDKITEDHKQIDLNKVFKQQLKDYETRFTNSLG